MDAVTKYLSHFAEPLCAVPFSGTALWDEAVVLPLHGERSGVPDLLASLNTAAGGRQILAILVVNGRATDEVQVQRANQELMAEFGVSNESTFLTYSSDLTLLIVDKASPGRYFPEDQGVGLARKLGCDIALRLQSDRRLQSRYVSTTDGDAKVAPDYFNYISRAAAVIHPYLHSDHGDNSEAHFLYEISLRYYVEGLRFAQSPYAFSTIGSTITVELERYAMVRGFPKRLAAEDFYLLNKLSKLGVIEEGGGLVTLTPRQSRRVPFGTGAATHRIVTGGLEDPFLFYHPQLFTSLKHLLKEVEAFIRTPDQTQLENNCRAWPGVFEVLDQAGAFRALNTAMQTRKTPAQRLSHFHHWFDGLKTLRFIHELRNSTYASVSMREALALAEFPNQKLWSSKNLNTLSDREILEKYRILQGVSA